MEACHPCDTRSQSMFPVDRGALASAWEEPTKCPWLSQGWLFYLSQSHEGGQRPLNSEEMNPHLFSENLSLPISTLGMTSHFLGVPEQEPVSFLFSETWSGFLTPSRVATREGRNPP